MDKEVIKYIIAYFRVLMTDDEKLALKYQIYMEKSSDNSEQRKKMIEKGWINSENKNN